MVSSQSLRPERDMTAAEMEGTHNRISISPDIVRTAAHALGYGEIAAFVDGKPSSLAEVYDVSDLIELMLRAQLSSLRLVNTSEQQKESEVAARLLQRVLAGDILTRREVHDQLPPETVVLFKMGPARLWGYAARQRMPRDAELAVPASFHEDPTGPYTDPKEAWLGAHVVEAGNLGSLQTVVDDVPIDDDRYQRLRLGIDLSDQFDQVWSSARGHWHISPVTRYIVPSRYGWCPYVFRIADGGWRRDSFDGSRDRYMATRGYFIDVANNRLLEVGEPDPANAWRPKVRPASIAPTERDLQVAGVLSDAIIALGASQRNPVIRLRQRGRNLF